MDINEILMNITLLHLRDIFLKAFAIIMVVIEFNKKIPFHPISYILGSFGKMLNKSLYEKMDEIEKQQEKNNKKIMELNEKVDKKFEEKQKDDDEKEAKRLRARIIEFADSCRVGNKHTQNHFENVFRDYDDYIRYCSKNSIPNHFIDAEHDYIDSVYHKCLKENRFL